MKEEKLKLVVVGISHKTSPISELELYQLSGKDISEALHFFKNENEVDGAVIISTCNRIEFYLMLNKNIDPFIIINKYFISKKGIDDLTKKESFYYYSNGDAANHLFKVVCGLDSMVLGEYQIQGQIKESYSMACAEKSAEKVLHKLFHAAFRVGKTVRTQTKIGSRKQSVSGVAYQILEEKLINNDAIAIIGVNQNTNIIVEKLSKARFSNLIFVNRTLYKAEKLADKYSGRAFGMNKIEEAISNVKCIFSCTGAPGYIITSDMLNRINSKPNNLKLIVDIAVPRDIDSCGLKREIEVFDLEGMKTYLKNQEKQVASELPIALKIINDEVNLFEAWSESQGDESIAYYDEKFESIRQKFLEESNQNLSEEELQLLDKYSRSLIHRLKSTIHQIVKTNKTQNKAS
jgi:glutamyl-tRNA reductase